MISDISNTNYDNFEPHVRKFRFRSPLFKSRRLYAPAPMKMITKRRLEYMIELHYYYEAPSINKPDFLHDRDKCYQCYITDDNTR